MALLVGRCRVSTRAFSACRACIRGLTLLADVLVADKLYAAIACKPCRLRGSSRRRISGEREVLKQTARFRRLGLGALRAKVLMRIVFYRRGDRVYWRKCFWDIRNVYVWVLRSFDLRPGRCVGFLDCDLC